jgi:hypothetical protein
MNDSIHAKVKIVSSETSHVLPVANHHLLKNTFFEDSIKLSTFQYFSFINSFVFISTGIPKASQIAHQINIDSTFCLKFSIGINTLSHLKFNISRFSLFLFKSIMSVLFI